MRNESEIQEIARRLMAESETLRTHTGFMRPCLVCGEPMLPSLSGRGYCLPCRVPPDDIPLVPASATVDAFLRIKRVWRKRERVEWKFQREVRDLLRDDAPRERARRGRTPKFVAADAKTIRRVVEHQPSFTVKLLVETASEHLEETARMDGEPPRGPALHEGPQHKAEEAPAAPRPLGTARIRPGLPRSLPAPAHFSLPGGRTPGSRLRRAPAGS